MNRGHNKAFVVEKLSGLKVPDQQLSLWPAAQSLGQCAGFEGGGGVGGVGGVGGDLCRPMSLSPS